MTLQQVAKQAGVSPSTVSRVINSMPGIAPETATNVRRVMESMAFTPARRRRGPVVRSPLRPLKGLRVAFTVLQNPSSEGVPAYDHMLRGVSNACNERNLDLQVSFVSDALAGLDRLIEKGYDGLLLHGAYPVSERARRLHSIPTVWLMGNRRRPSWGDQVMPDNVTIGQIAAQYLLRRGHRNVLYFGLRSGWSMDVRALAFHQAIEDAGATVKVFNQGAPTLDLPGPRHVEEGLAAVMAEIKAASPAPTGLFVAEDWLLRATYAALQSAGLQPGTDMDIISCNNDRPHLLGLDPTPATIDIRFERIGYRAVEQLVARLQGNVPLDDRVRMMIEPTLVPPPNDRSGS